MNAYHTLMVHFPIALWMTATLAIFFRVCSDGPLAKSVSHALVPLLSASLAFGIVAFAIGLTVWPLETISASAIGRNHMLLATWTISYWAVILYVLWRRGEAAWQGTKRWIMAGLAFLGSALLGITGTLGGHLTGTYTGISALLRMLGWEVYTTYYVPDYTLIALAAISLALLVLAFWKRKG